MKEVFFLKIWLLHVILDHGRYPKWFTMKTELTFSGTDDFGLILKYCGVEYCEPKFSMRSHRRKDFLFHYVFHGSGYFRCREREFSLSVGSIFAIFAGEVVSYSVIPEDPMNFCWIGFTGKNASRLVEIMGFSINDPVLTLDPHNDILKLITRCVQLCKLLVPYSDIEIQSILYKIFHVICSKQNCTRRSDFQNNTSSLLFSSPSLRSHVSRAKNYIQLFYMKPLTIQEIADKINLDRTYLSKIFHLIEGITLHNYLTGFRMESAKRMLLETTYNIQQIADLAGVSDGYYFSRLFKKYTGSTPSQYRRDQRMKKESSPLPDILTHDELQFSGASLLVP